eukprot:c3652_g1_i1.p1 GENE.c3652_g1_i1~~c3652_g1_i1.p1  ORF type:complete len:317 (-),score=58.48 c3652_g1_i1:114-1064(-)
MANTIWTFLGCVALVQVYIMWRFISIEYDLKQTKVRTSSSKKADGASSADITKQLCDLVSAKRKAQLQPLSGSVTVKLDVRDYGTKTVHGIVPAQTYANITIVSVCADLSFCDIAEKNFRRYAECHGYQLSFIKKKIGDSSRSPHWTKIKAVQGEIEKGAQYVFWMDADSLFMDFSTGIESLLTQTSHDMWAEADLNTGHFLVKNTPWTKQFLQEWFDTYPSPRPWNDQSSLMWLVGGKRPDCREELKIACYAEISDEMQSHIVRVDRRVMSSYLWEYQPGDYIIHFPGMQAAKLMLMKKYAPKATLFSVPIDGKE